MVVTSTTTFNSLQHHHQHHLISFTGFCKYLSPFCPRVSHLLPTFSPPGQRVRPKRFELVVDRVHASFPKAVDEIATKDATLRVKRQTFSRDSVRERKGGNFGDTLYSSKVKEKESAEKRFREDEKRRENLGFVKDGVLVNGKSSFRFKDEKTVLEDSKDTDIGKAGKKMRTDGGDMLGGENTIEGSKKSKVESPVLQLRVELDMCSKRGDVIGAIRLFDKAQRQGVKMGQYHYAVILYLCSSAAAGVIHPAKSGNGTRTLNTPGIQSVPRESLGEIRITTGENYNDGKFPDNGIYKSHGNTSKVGLGSSVSFHNSDSSFEEIKGKEPVKSIDQLDSGNSQEEQGLLVTEDVKKYALQRGFEIYKKMCLENIPMNEASLTAVARMATAMNDGDMAFDMVKQMKSLGINPRLRSYAPALSTFCNNGDINKAFEVEKHMLENGVYPEEPELETLLKVSVEAGKADKVYYLLHKLRTTVRSVSPSTADIITRWFESKAASRVGKKKCDSRKIKEAIRNGGGGWHGHGWLGRGKWTVSKTVIGADGFCKFCGEKLEMIDLDPVETENFARSVATIAMKREKTSSFQKFQKWLEYYGPFEAVIDAANVGLFSQKKFKPAKVNSVVNGIRQLLPSRKWPLIVLHNRRITGEKMDEPSNQALIEKWRNADALYATPTGSNDDWYWLYAAIKFKCLIVTNDEMRDHTFQLLGNDFFPKWKERHQVHFSFSGAGPEFHMPPPYSIVVQETEEGHWHIPIVSQQNYEEDRTWLCIVRANSIAASQTSATDHKDLQSSNRKEEHTGPTTPAELKVLQRLSGRNTKNGSIQTREIYENLRGILSGSDVSDRCSILSQLEAAEKRGGCVIDFQI